MNGAGGRGSFKAKANIFVSSLVSLFSVKLFCCYCRPLPLHFLYFCLIPEVCVCKRAECFLFIYICFCCNSRRLSMIICSRNWYVWLPHFRPLEWFFAVFIFQMSKGRSGGSKTYKRQAETKGREKFSPASSGHSNYIDGTKGCFDDEKWTLAFSSTIILGECKFGKIIADQMLHARSMTHLLLAYERMMSGPHSVYKYSTIN